MFPIFRLFSTKVCFQFFDCFHFRFEMFSTFALDSSFQPFLKFHFQKNQKLIASIQIQRDVQNIFCGNAVFKVAAKRPPLPRASASTTLDKLVAISMDPKSKQALWLLFDTDADFEDWIYHVSKIAPDLETIPTHGNYRKQQ